tara:strand:+ start:92 stop:361 length:270 start_codon:yes stop_codon:yes gene_type:complete
MVGNGARTAKMVCADAVRPNMQDTAAVRDAVANWPIDADARKVVKRILNINDCRMGVSDGCILAEAPGDCLVVAIDVDDMTGDWACIQE